MDKADLEVVLFDSLDLQDWIKIVSGVYERHCGGMGAHEALMDFDASMEVGNIKPTHLVTLACLIQYLDNLETQVSISRGNQKVFDYIYNELGFHEYWGGGKNHVEPLTSTNVFNLWRIVESEKDMYAKNVENYFRRIYFHDRDLSSVSVSLVEAYYNVFDHANADGNAFSILQYDEISGRLHVAISDFGIGIVQSVRDFDGNVGSDSDAILKAIEDNFTVGSTGRNKGMGLGNILAPTDEALLVSHCGWVTINRGMAQGADYDFWYPGTLVCFDIDLSVMEKEEFLEEFSL